MMLDEVNKDYIFLKVLKSQLNELKTKHLEKEAEFINKYCKLHVGDLIEFEYNYKTVRAYIDVISIDNIQTPLNEIPVFITAKFKDKYYGIKYNSKTVKLIKQYDK